MTVGLPGVGIGGMFYIVSALVMPFREIARTLRERRGPGRWRVVATQMAMALAIVLAIAAAGITLGWAVGWIQPAMVSRLGSVGSGPGAGEGVPTVLKTAAVFLTFGTLFAVLTAVQVLRLVVRQR